MTPYRADNKILFVEEDGGFRVWMYENDPMPYLRGKWQFNATWLKPDEKLSWLTMLLKYSITQKDVLAHAKAISMEE